MGDKRTRQFGDGQIGHEGICDCGQPMATHTRCSVCNILTGAGHHYHQVGKLCNGCHKGGSREKGGEREAGSRVLVPRKK